MPWQAAQALHERVWRCAPKKLVRPGGGSIESAALLHMRTSVCFQCGPILSHMSSAVEACDEAAKSPSPPPMFECLDHPESYNEASCYIDISRVS